MEYTVASVDEAIRLLQWVGAHPGCGVTELAGRSGITKNRAFRLLATLERRHLVRRDGPDACYYLGHEALHLGQAARDQIDLARIAQPHIDALGELFNEAISLRVRDGLESCSVARRHSSLPLRVQSQMGLRRPLYVGAAGRILLAAAPPEVQAQVLDQTKSGFTEATPVTAAILGRRLKQTRRSGHAVSLGELYADTVGVAVPVFDADRQVVAALGITAPSSRGSRKQVDAMLVALQTTAAAIGQELGLRLG